MKVLLYVDPGIRGEWALGPAVDLLRGARGTVTLLTSDENRRRDPDLLSRAARAFEALEGVTVETKVRPGTARDAILAESAESRPALTIFPPAGRGFLGRMLHGSRVRTVLENAPSTVMVARRPVSEHIHRVLVAIRGGPFTETLLLCSMEVAEALGAEITVLHVTSSIALPFPASQPAHARAGKHAAKQPSSVRPEGQGTVEDAGAAEALELQEADARLEETVARLGLSSRVRKREGLVVSEILAECRDGRHDLLIVGQHLAEQEAEGPLAENLAQILAVESPIPVLMVRPRLWARAREAASGSSSTTPSSPRSGAAGGGTGSG